MPFIAAKMVKGSPAEAGIVRKDQIIALKRAPAFLQRLLQDGAGDENKPVQVNPWCGKKRTMTLSMSTTETGDRHYPFRFHFSIPNGRNTLLPRHYLPGWRWLVFPATIGKSFRAESSAQNQRQPGGFGTIGAMFGNEWQWALDMPSCPSFWHS